MCVCVFGCECQDPHILPRQPKINGVRTPGDALRFRDWEQRTQKLQVLMLGQPTACQVTLYNPSANWRMWVTQKKKKNLISTSFPRLSPFFPLWSWVKLPFHSTTKEHRNHRTVLLFSFAWLPLFWTAVSKTETPNILPGRLNKRREKQSHRKWHDKKAQLKKSSGFQTGSCYLLVFKKKNNTDLVSRGEMFSWLYKCTSQVWKSRDFYFTVEKNR